ncbi:MAG: glycosyltransferase family 4 protein [Planctomycetes bacterium]|nr:glycosyltransferase family 4 protein [Planctomycetota bacterium]
MRVAFDTAPLLAERAYPLGVRRACAGLVEALERGGRLEVVRLAPERGESEKAWRQRRVPAELARTGAAGFHALVSAFPLRGPGRRVQTVHELPWRHGAHENADLRHRLWAALGPRRADAVLCPSEHVARDLRRGWLVPAAKVHVVPWGVDARFADEAPPGVVDEVVLRRYAIPDGPFVLCPGAVRAKKDLAALLQGLRARLDRGERGVHVVVTGPDTPDLRRDLGLVSRLELSRWVRTPGLVADEDLPSLLRLASVVAVLSRSEGFAFPVLEAHACGTPVLVPRASAQAELAGAAGFAVDARDPASVADGLAAALERREALRYRLADGARDFTWERCARAVEDLWLEWER